MLVADGRLGVELDVKGNAVGRFIMPCEKMYEGSFIEARWLEVGYRY